MLTGLNFRFVYIDEFLIASENEEKHKKKHLFLVLQRLKQFGLTINIQKSIFGENCVKFLSYSITAEGTSWDKDRGLAIQNFKLPNVIKDLGYFLGIINFYRR